MLAGQGWSCSSWAVCILQGKLRHEGWEWDPRWGLTAVPPSSSTATAGGSHRHSPPWEMMTEPTHPSNEKGPQDDAAGHDAFRQRFAHMKSWPGLLRVLGGLQLLCGGMAFICVCADIPRGRSAHSSELLLGGGLGVPLTPFVLAVLSLAWLLTALLLGLGVTARYRRILLGVTWWPPTEAGLHVLLFVLCLAAVGAHIHTVTLGGLCSSPLPGSPHRALPCGGGSGGRAPLPLPHGAALLGRQRRGSQGVARGGPVAPGGCSHSL